MKIRAHIYVDSSDRLSEAQTDLMDCAYPGVLTFDLLHHRSDGSVDVNFSYEGKYARSVNALVYSFVDFVTSAAAVHDYKVWFDSIEETENVELSF